MGCSRSHPVLAGTQACQGTGGPLGDQGNGMEGLWLVEWSSGAVELLPASAPKISNQKTSPASSFTLSPCPHTGKDLLVTKLAIHWPTDPRSRQIKFRPTELAGSLRAVILASPRFLTLAASQLLQLFLIRAQRRSKPTSTQLLQSLFTQSLSRPPADRRHTQPPHILALCRPYHTRPGSSELASIVASSRRPSEAGQQPTSLPPQEPLAGSGSPITFIQLESQDQA